MSRIAELSDNRVTDETTIFAYGFDAAGFPTGCEPVAVPGLGRIEFLNFYSPTSLESADGIIVPQGIFEKIDSRSSPVGPKTNVSVDKFLLLERERQVFDLLRAGKWVCFLVGEIVDEISQGIHLEPIHDTDLCKRLLNAFAVGRRHKYHLYIDHPRQVRAREPEFASYVRDYGTPTTVFEFSRLHPIERHVIIDFGEQAVGIEFDTQLFFLPFGPSRRDSSAAAGIAETVAWSITRYRRNRVVHLPPWLDELRFKTETDLYLEINALLEKLNRLESQLLSWKDYKSILVASDVRLRNKVVAILESVFGLEVEAEENRETLTVKNGDRRPILILEARSAERSVEKAFVDAIHEHRKAAGLPDTMKAVLVVNSDTLIHDTAKRTEARVSDEVADHAKALNVLIVRTIDLLLLVRQLEKDPDRGEKLTRLFLSGGGCFKSS